MWHGSDISNPAHWTPRSHVFLELPHVPSQFYYNVSITALCVYVYHIQLKCVHEMLLFKVKDVRTNDDTLITVKLMIFYELSDIETMVCSYAHMITPFLVVFLFSL